MTERENLLEDLRQALQGLDTNQLFGEDEAMQEIIEDLCVRLLKNSGYKVTRRPTITSMNHVDQLVDFFYHTKNSYHDEGFDFVANRNKDIAIMSRFVKQRKDALDCATKFAINDTALIIKTLFEIETELNLDIPLGIWVFGTDKCRWITDRAIGVINDKYKDFNEVVVEQMVEECEALHGDEYRGFDFDEIYKRRNLDAKKDD